MVMEVEYYGFGEFVGVNVVNIFNFVFYEYVWYYWE